jgi:DNA-directed RNA polymerase subunit K/omega
MSDSGDESYDENLNDFIDGDSDIEDNLNEEIPKFKRDKTTPELDNNDNENDYIDDDIDEDNDESGDPELYENDYDVNEEDNEDVDENEKNYIEENINFNDNDLDNNSAFQFIVQSDDKITSNILTIYELVELISIRGSQIANGSYVFTDITGISEPTEMAKKEIMDNKCPLYIKRHIGLDRYELWSPNLMSKPKI